MIEFFYKDNLLVKSILIFFIFQFIYNSFSICLNKDNIQYLGHIINYSIWVSLIFIIISAVINIIFIKRVVFNNRVIEDKDNISYFSTNIKLLLSPFFVMFLIGIFKILYILYIPCAEWYSYINYKVILYITIEITLLTLFSIFIVNISSKIILLILFIMGFMYSIFINHYLYKFSILLNKDLELSIDIMLYFIGLLDYCIL